MRKIVLIFLTTTLLALSGCTASVAMTPASAESRLKNMMR
jgi:uncharacterized protein YceK